jgi:hypothetical protein
VRCPVEALAILLVLQSATARAETEAEAAPAPSTDPTESPEATLREPSGRTSRHGADCQLCDVGASGLELGIPLWLPIVSLEGELPQGDGSQKVKFEPQLEFALVGELRLRLGPVGVGLSANGASLGTQVVRSNTGDALGTVDLAAYFGRITLDWYTPPFRFSGGSRTELLAIWPYLGARYALISGSGSDPSGTLLFDGSTSWGEPLFGVDVLLDLRRGWLFRVGGDVGGFSLGSEISVWSAAEVRYAVTDWLNLRVGWRLYYARFPLEDSTATLLMQGPGVGFGVPLF